jgi:phospholipid/cholesterol/gamma-HCH transport system substrate-binding protein
MENKSHAIAAGAFVIFVAGLLIVLTVWLLRPGEDRVRYEVVTQDPVTGLLLQANVQFRGVKVGKVIDIDLDAKKPGQVIVLLELDSSTPVTQTTYATLDYQGLTGIAFVQLNDVAEPAARMVAQGSQLPRIPMRTGSWTQWQQQGEKVLQELQVATRRVNEILAPENQKLLRQSLENLSLAAAAVPPMLKETTQTVVLMRDSATRVSAAADRVRSTAEDYSTLARTVQQPGGVLDQVQQSVQSVAAASQSLQQGSVVRINRLLDSADKTSRQLGHAVSTLDDNPQTLLYGPPWVMPGPGEPGFVAPRSTP